MAAKQVPAYEGKAPFLFVSYAHKDSEKVLPTVNGLFDKKYRVWYDEGIAPGSEWPKNIADHLKDAGAFILFVSEQYLASPNCENEAVRAAESGKKIFLYSLDGSTHPGLTGENSAAVSSDDELMSVLPDSYIGDGTGYDREIGRQRFGALWNALIAVAAALMLAIGGGLVGLNRGWFDSYLPGLDTSADAVLESQQLKARQEENITLDNSFLAGAIAVQTGRRELNEPITFNDERSADAFYGWLEWNGEEEHRYIDLTFWGGDYIEPDYCDQEQLSLMPYFPNLRELRLREGRVSDLTVLADCPKLERVYVPYELFPLTISENAGFDIILE